MFLYRFDELMSKIILKKIKNIILIYFRAKNISNRYHTFKYSTLTESRR
jgi:hypothetical protein